MTDVHLSNAGRAIATRGELEELARKVDAALGEPPSIARLRAELNRVGIHDARVRLREAPELLRHAQDAFRRAQEIEKDADQRYREVLAENRWAFDGNFEARSNKTWLVTDAAGNPIPLEEQRSFDAAERKAWIDDKIGRLPDVRTAAVALSAAERQRAQAADEVAHAETNFRAARHDVDAACAELSFLALALGSHA